MRKRIEKTLSVFLAIALLFSCIITMPNIKASAATSGVCGDNATYVIEDGTLTISGTGNTITTRKYSDCYYLWN